MSIKLVDTLEPMADFPAKKSDLSEYMNRIDKCIYSQIG